MGNKIDDLIFRKLPSWFKKDFDWFADLELLIPVIIATVAIVVGPLLFSWYLIRHNYQWYSIAIGLIWLISMLQLIKDYRNRKFSLISKIVFVLWIGLFGTITIIFIVADFL